MQDELRLGELEKLARESEGDLDGDVVTLGLTDAELERHGLGDEELDCDDDRERDGVPEVDEEPVEEVLRDGERVALTLTDGLRLPDGVGLVDADLDAARLGDGEWLPDGDALLDCVADALPVHDMYDAVALRDHDEGTAERDAALEARDVPVAANDPTSRRNPAAPILSLTAAFSATAAASPLYQAPPSVDNTPRTCCEGSVATSNISKRKTTLLRISLEAALTQRHRKSGTTTAAIN